jgi:hypothetical protein
MGCGKIPISRLPVREVGLVLGFWQGAQPGVGRLKCTPSMDSCEGVQARGGFSYVLVDAALPAPDAGRPARRKGLQNLRGGGFFG